MPRNRKLMKLRWPNAGLDKRQSYRNQPPFTTPDCLNVRPEGPLERRLRGGTRPGLNKYFGEQISGAANPIYLLSSVTVIKNDGFTFFADDFTGTAMADVWSAASWWGNALPTITDGSFANLSTTNTQVGAILDTVSPALDSSQDYFIELLIVPDPATGSFGGTYSLFARMDNTTPDVTDEGVVATITMNDATEAWTVTLTEYNGGTPTAYTGTAGTGTDPASPGVLSMLISVNDITVAWRGTEVISAQTVTAQTGLRLGFGMNCSVTGGVCAADAFRLQYYADDVADRTRTVTVASANGELWRDIPWIGQMTELTTGLSLADDRPIDAAERVQKLYIADRGDLKAVGTDGARGSANDRFDSATYADWSTLGLSTDDDVLVISSATGVLIDGTYQISTVAAGELTVTPNCATGAGAASANFRIERGPKIYDPNTDTLALWVATTPPANQVPTGCQNIELYRDRMVLTKDTSWFMSAVNDPLDWDFSGELATSAVSGANADAGLVGAPIQSLLAFHDDYLVFGCRNSTWILRGDPKYAGVIGALSYVVGGVDVDAMTLTPEGICLLMTSDGLYGLSPGSEEHPTKVSEQLPEELHGLLTSSNYIAVEFDSEWDGAYIIISPNGQGATKHYWFDWQRKSYWPIEFPKAYDPTKIHRRRSVNESSQQVLFGCRDGYIRILDRNAPTDDGTSIDSYVTIGPIRAGGDYHDGNLETIECTLGTLSGDVDWEIYIGDTHEAAARETTAIDSGTFSQEGKQYTARIRVRAGSYIIKLVNNGNTPWTMEELFAVVEQTRQRRRY